MHDRFVQALSSVKAVANGLEALRIRVENLGSQSQDAQVQGVVHDAIPLTLQTKFEKARLVTSELMDHVQAKSKTTARNPEHYRELIGNITVLSDQLASLDPTTSLGDLDQKLVSVEKKLAPLTIQAPYTLLMMRVVEIGLPVLLSLLSLSLLLRYSLTEQRSREIKAILTQRNAAPSEAASEASGATMV